MAGVPPGSHAPITPSNAKVNNQDPGDEMTTKSMGSVTISATVDDPDASQPVRLVVRYSSNNFKSYRTAVGSYDHQNSGHGVKDTATLTGLLTNTLYKAHLYSQAIAPGADRLSINYKSVSFWTNRKPTVDLVAPAQNQEFPDNAAFLFDWKFTDPDGGDQKDYQVQYRTVGSTTWTTLRSTSAENAKHTFRNYTATALAANRHYVWRVRAQDKQGLWGDWGLEQSFFVRGQFSPPLLISPLGGRGRGVVVTQPVMFTWKFRDPDPHNKQYQADIRWRVAHAGGGTSGVTTSGAPTGDEGWFVTRGAGDVPGTKNQWQIASGYLIPGNLYEWQVRTYDAPARLVPSGWSNSGYFMAVGTPGSAIQQAPEPDMADIQGELGCGHHRVFIYYQGGLVRVGEVTPLSQVQWGRKRDDIANAIITTNGFGADCCELLGSLRSWVHEVVIYRDNDRVFEGPITRLTYAADSVEIEAKDVMAYLYRRIMREGYDDAYRRIDLTPLTPSAPLPSTKGGPYLITGQSTVVRRAAQIAINALAYKDPNVLPYLTILDNDGDATNNRVVPDYSRTAWEEIDDLAATAGLDYVTIGRRIMLWDTHHAIGRLPEMRDGDFSDPVIVTEYGMQTANFFAVTNNSGQWGARYPQGLNDDNWFQSYGPVEMLASGYGETQGGAADTEALTTQALAKLTKTYEEQARRNIAHRWPTPVVVRVPDNSTLNPKINLGIQQLVPGVWVPLRATATCREVSQWQKLDEVNVQEADGLEQVQVVLSPAPNGGNDDPDATSDTQD
jgi:hypothetical protein